MLGRYKDYKPKDLGKLLERKLKMPWYWGVAHTCPACGTRLRRFKPIWKSFPRKLKEAGFIYPLESFETFNFEAFLCPSCNCSDRERLYALYLRRWIASHQSGARHVLVDFAPSHALSSWLRTEATVHYRSADLFRPNVDDKIDITNMPEYAQDSVDAFICSHVLEHIPDDLSSMRELHRILKPGGFGIIMVPLIQGVTETHEDPAISDPQLRWRYFGQDDHVRLYGTSDFVRQLSSVGFHVDRLGMEHFGAESFRRAAIADNSILYVVSKQR